MLSVNSPDSGAAEEELAVAYGDEQLEIVAQLDQINAYMLLLAPLVPDAAGESWRADLGSLAEALLEQYAVVAVEEAGEITFPILGRLRVAGFTTSEIGRHLDGAPTVRFSSRSARTGTRPDSGEL